MHVSAGCITQYFQFACTGKLDELENLIQELRVQSGIKAVVFAQWARQTPPVRQCD